MEKFRIPAKTQHLNGKRETWVHSARPVHRSFGASGQKCMFHFGPLGHEKTAETARFGPSTGKTEILVVFTLGIIRPIFSPADQAVFMGLVVRRCHFEARQLDNV